MKVFIVYFFKMFYFVFFGVLGNIVFKVYLKYDVVFNNILMDFFLFFVGSICLVRIKKRIFVKYIDSLIYLIILDFVSYVCINL